MTTHIPTDSGLLDEIRQAIRKICTDFPGTYWQDLDRARAYPTDFVNALTSSGWLAALIPEEYGGSGLTMEAATVILEEIHACGCNAAACHAQMYTMGTVMRHGSNEQKQKYLPSIAQGKLRLQAFGVTEPSSGTDTLALKTTAKKLIEAGVLTGRKYGRHALNILILCYCLPAPPRAIRWKNAPMGYPSFY